MAWDKPTVNGHLVAQEVLSNMLNNGTSYSSEIDFGKYDHRQLTKFLGYHFVASAVTGTNLDIALMGAHSSGGTKILLLDAVVADITDNTPVIAFKDINLYPMPYYYIRIITDGDETSNTLTITITV